MVRPFSLVIVASCLGNIVNASSESPTPPSPTVPAANTLSPTGGASVSTDYASACESVKSSILEKVSTEVRIRKSDLSIC